MDHVTPVLAVPATVAENCWVCDPVREAMPGVTETVIPGFSVTVEVANMVGSAVDLAVSVTF